MPREPLRWLPPEELLLCPEKPAGREELPILLVLTDGLLLTLGRLMFGLLLTAGRLA
ncbi:MAG: hypothetical protein IKZ13_00450 [Akkermansia sp.]|nr:hypothetical protein [Akkermansia sp.]